ncbi:endolytic transglycosylase MltG [Paenibacillus sp. Marseille-Q4541]|uniref:endolytic transglycosylase MltG n=1 Tax=Paenibacillus sp. Marseille-Q4541 TaxID=2831522 RepID=UPI0024B4F74B|nr:endolytic transglycosylase MltG [Paenibacillus sp. Marseille-Q4541]
MKAKYFRRFIILIVIMVVLAGSALYVWQSMRPVASASEPVIFTIDKGTGTAQIADKLEENGLIRNSFFFKVYLKLNNEGSNFKAGTYAFVPGQSYKEIITSLNNGDVQKEETLKFTIPEGYTLKQIAEKLDTDGVTVNKLFMDMINQPELFQDIPLVAEIPDNPDYLFKLEGYLFPETYELKKGSTAEDIIIRMLTEMQAKLDAIPDFEAKLKARGLTVHELLTVASLIEREVVVPEERPLVAGVIYNRLEKNMRLEMDATVQYLLDKQKERLLYKDLEVKSPYNTYRNAGLPPGPIASPSLSAIEAALSPEASDYLFYVTKKDGSSEHLFAKTYEEHLENIEKSKESAE